MDFQWDARKAAVNLQKHDVGFADAVGVFFDDLALTIDDEGSAEERYVTVGMDPLGRILVVVYTWRGKAIRIISARRADAGERKQYEEGP
jgi:hypothetical protein